MKSSLEARLGPKVHDAEDDVEAKSVMSRVVVEQQKSREDVLAEETQKMDKKEKQRNRRMFGNLLGTLQKFKQDENRDRKSTRLTPVTSRSRMPSSA